MIAKLSRNKVIQYFLNSSLFVLLAFLLFRIFEFFYLYSKYDLLNEKLKFKFTSLLFDIPFFFGLNTLVLCIIIPLGFYRFKIAKGLFFSFFSIIFVIYAILIFYFAANMIPLDRVLFNYNFSDIKHTVFTSAQLDGYMIVPVFIGLFCFLSIKWISRFNLHIVFVVLFIALHIGSIIFLQKLKPKRENYRSNLQFQIASNKLMYFSEDIFDFVFTNEQSYNKDNILAEIRQFQNNTTSFEYQNTEYPHLRKRDTSDVLGPFFRQSKIKPNIVFILAESLSRAFSGDSAYQGSFTPFIDSLAQHSLYWNNFLSTAERTFGVLPSVFGSLPHGKKGFTEMGYNMPDHVSLIRLLKQAGYYTSFFYGGWMRFDNMDIFLQQQNIDYILDYFGPQYTEIDSTGIGYSWGYPDKELVSRAIEVIDSFPKNPRLDIFLTVSTHYPFRIPEKEKYEAIAKKRMKKIGYDDDKVKRNEHAIPFFATVMYLDDVIKKLIENYKKKQSFENTIFIITGDHRSPGASKSDIDNYHVPFLIYSPLLKAVKKFNSLSSHNNITPSLITYLHKNYNIKCPNHVHWTHSVLDTTTFFTSNLSLSFMRHNKKVDQFIHGEYFLSESQLYKIEPGLMLKPEKNAVLKDSLSRLLKNITTIDHYVCENNYLYPPKLFFQNSSKKPFLSFDIDFEKENYNDNQKIYEKNRTSGHTLSGDKSVFVSEDLEFSNLLDKTYLDKEYKQIDINLDFFIFLQDTIKENLPQLIFEVFDKNKEQQQWRSYAFKTFANEALTKEKWIKIKFRKILENSDLDLSEGSYFYAYLWNNKKAELYYDDLSVKITSELE